MDEVARAIEALQSPYNAEHSKEASIWLNSFAETPEAWEISVSLLDPSRSAFVQFFAANLLLSKARREWSQLSQQDRSSISSALRCIYLVENHLSQSTGILNLPELALFPCRCVIPGSLQGRHEIRLMLGFANRLCSA